MRYFSHNTADIHPSAYIGDGVKIWNNAQIRENAQVGEGTIISKNVYVDESVKVGSRVKVQNNVSIYKGVTVEDDVFIGPSVVFTNDKTPRAFNSDWEVSETQIRFGSSLGAGCVILCGIEVGEFAMIGAGSVVTKSVPSHALVVGSVGRVIGFVYKSGVRISKHHYLPEAGAFRCTEGGEELVLDDYSTGMILNG